MEGEVTLVVNDPSFAAPEYLGRLFCEIEINLCLGRREEILNALVASGALREEESHAPRRKRRRDGTGLKTTWSTSASSSGSTHHPPGQRNHIAISGHAGLGHYRR
jgi:hypothetical protein